MLFTLVLFWAFLLCGVAAQNNTQTAKQAVTFDNTCDDAQKSVIVEALDGAFRLARTVSEQPEGGVNDGPAFWDLFGPSASSNRSIVLPVFDRLVHNRWNISASCDLNNSAALCTDRYLHGGIAGNGSWAEPRFLFCKEFWLSTPLGIQARKGVYNPNTQARFDIGYYSENHGETAPFHSFWD